MKPKTAVKAERLKAKKDAFSDLIRALRGSYKGPDSLLKNRERDHKRDERIKSRKFAAIMN